jgi:hypothetical protein
MEVMKAGSRPTKKHHLTGLQAQYGKTLLLNILNQQELGH